MIRFYFLIITLLLESSGYGSNCGNLLGMPMLPTAQFVAYMQTLLDSRVVGDRELLHLIGSIDRGTLTNPIMKESVVVNSDLHVHREGLENIILRAKIDESEVLEWAKRSLSEKAAITVKRGEAREDTRAPFQKMIFHRIDPNANLTGDEIGLKNSTPFEMMSTPVTQKHWTLFIQSNISPFAKGDQSITTMIDGKLIVMQPDHPIESVTYQEVQAYIGILNAYSKIGDPRLYDLIPDHRKGDQYRLPYDFEWEYVATNRGRNAAKLFYLTNYRSELSEYAWFHKDSTQAVGQKQPLVVDGKEFFDMLGNVWEFTQDFWRAGAISRGGSWEDAAPTLTKRYDVPAHERSNTVGFRLIRERKP